MSSLIGDCGTGGAAVTVQAVTVVLRLVEIEKVLVWRLCGIRFGWKARRREEVEKCEVTVMAIPMVAAGDAIVGFV